GAELVPFSPIKDCLPDVDGLYFGGGYPELFAAELENNTIRATVRKMSEGGMPIYAESGGLMYLSEGISDMVGKRYEMCGVFESESKMNDKRKSLGYVEMTSNFDNILCKKGWSLRGHEFHYSTTAPSGQEVYAFDLSRGKGIEDGKDGMAVHNTVAGYTHIHFASNPKIPKRFIDCCIEYSKK
ncbi:MAG: hypothetical protein FWG60_01655, partial [Methanomassiliicoccaceae archaeon]|nr:hypothetical protein [Methanomassiliicoccaceae archaeon]